MTSNECPDCGHRWLDHPGALSLQACAVCVYEEDQGRRDEVAMCSRFAAGIEDVPAGQLLVARFKSRRFPRGDQIALEDHAGLGWALIRPPGLAREEVHGLLQQVQGDLATMPLTQFRAKYRALMN